MADRADIVEAALDVYREGLALLDGPGRIVFWNRAAESITGYPALRLVGKPTPQPLDALANPSSSSEDANPAASPTCKSSIVHVQHLRGHDVALWARRLVLRDMTGQRIGTAAVFHPAELSAALPHGETSGDAEVTESRTDFQDRLELEYLSFQNGEAAFAVLWIRVDQAFQLRRSHGARACEAMLETVERTLANSLHADEEVGRWGDDEFLVLLREVTAEPLMRRAQIMAGQARTSEFHWWGDRITLTVSVGGAEAHSGESLAELLQRTQNAMQSSVHAGGNQVSLASGRQA